MAEFTDIEVRIEANDRVCVAMAIWNSANACKNMAPSLESEDLRDRWARRAVRLRALAIQIWDGFPK